MYIFFQEQFMKIGFPPLVVGGWDVILRCFLLLIYYLLLLLLSYYFDYKG